MWTLTRDGVPVAYRYGPDWVGVMLFVEGGYPTREEAVDAWNRYKEENEK